MKILHNVQLKGERKEIPSKALIDTGASVSMLSEAEARDIGAWITNCSIPVSGVHGDIQKLDILLADIKFPSLKCIGGRVPFVMGKRTIVGMDILNPLGVVIDTATGNLSLKNEIWEAFKTLTTTGVIIWGVATVVDAISETPIKNGPHRKRKS